MNILDEDLWTAEEVAEQVGVAAGTIYTWVSRGYLCPAGTRGKFKLFRLDDVFNVEKARDRKRRKRTVAC